VALVTFSLSLAIYAYVAIFYLALPIIRERVVLSGD
jgi:hypothetical protein